jgi:molecular chaperone DnaK (HSP70)
VAAAAIESDLERIVQAARETARRAGLAPEAIDTLYFTGGSTGLPSLVQRIGDAFPSAQVVRGDRFASVAQGLGVHARAVFGPRPEPATACDIGPRVNRTARWGAVVPGIGRSATRRSP